jgi:hypothetical protein
MKQGGLRIPSLKKLEEEGIRLSKEAANRIELIDKTRPRQVRIYKKDLDRLRFIGKGDWKKGFYRVMNLAHSCWLQDDDITRLKNIGNGNARQGLIDAMKIAEEQNGLKK